MITLTQKQLSKAIEPLLKALNFDDHPHVNYPANYDVPNTTHLKLIGMMFLDILPDEALSHRLGDDTSFEGFNPLDFPNYISPAYEYFTPILRMALYPLGVTFKIVDIEGSDDDHQFCLYIHILQPD